MRKVMMAVLGAAAAAGLLAGAAAAQGLKDPKDVRVTFVVHGSMTGERTGTYSGTGSNTLSFDPDSDFLPGEQVQATFTGGSTVGIRADDGSYMSSGYVWQFRVGSSAGPTIFCSASEGFGTGTDNTEGVAVGDLDGDGNPDVALGNDAQQNVVYLNDGLGSFSTGPW